MSVDALSAVTAQQLDLDSLSAIERSRQGNFAAWLQEQVGETNAKINESDRWVQRLAVGETDNLHQVMIALDEAKFSFQLLTQMRNKLLEAYQDILRMQV
jgi:flagellar hook-basal body complex protein FliE